MTDNPSNAKYPEADEKAAAHATESFNHGLYQDTFDIMKAEYSKIQNSPADQTAFRTDLEKDLMFEGGSVLYGIDEQKSAIKVYEKDRSGNKNEWEIHVPDGKVI